MRAADPAPPAKKTPPSGYVWGLLAALTCPCHLPLVVVLLAGTAAGAIVNEHRGLAFLALTVLFVLFLAATLRAFRGRS